jgi:hypothetical protein
MRCQRCGSGRRGPLPEDIDEISDAMGAFIDEHERCPAPPTVIGRMWVIYFGARNHPPGAWVLRAHDMMSDGSTRPAAAAHVFRSLEAARSRVPADTSNQGRKPGDDPVIFEVWV